MLVVLLTHTGDRQLTVQLCDHIRFLGGVSKHECLIVSPAGTDMRGIEDVLREAFGNVYTHQYTATMKGWPYGPNEAAAEAMQHVWMNPALHYHFLMLEPDCVPVNKQWLDYIDTEYRRSGAQMLGTRIDTVEIATNRVVGKHTIGVAAYPKNFAKLCPLVKSIVGMTQEYHRQKAMPAPWDAYFGPYTARMTADTTLIQHLSRVRKQEPDGRVWWDCPSLENALSQVRPDAMLIHGSKDLAFLPAITGRRVTTPVIEPKKPTFEEIAALPNGHVIKTPSGPIGNIAIESAALNAKARKKEIKAMPWKALRSLAAKLGVLGTRMKRPALEKAVLAKESELSKNGECVSGLNVSVDPGHSGEQEPGAALNPHGRPEGSNPSSPMVPVEQTPRLPLNSLPISHGVKTTVQWKPVDEKGNPIPDAPTADGMTEMQRKMLALRSARASVLMGAPSAA